MILILSNSLLTITLNDSPQSNNNYNDNLTKIYYDNDGTTTTITNTTTTTDNIKLLSSSSSSNHNYPTTKQPNREDNKLLLQQAIIANKETESRNNKQLRIDNNQSDLIEYNDSFNISESDYYHLPTIIKSDQLERDDDGTNNGSSSATMEKPLPRQELDDAMEHGLKAMQVLLEIKEPQWYRMGLYLGDDEPGRRVADFGTPRTKAVQQLSSLGYAAVEAAKRIAETYPDNVGRQGGFLLQSRLLLDDCPLRGRPRCPSASRRYRTADGTCNNLKHPWRGSSTLPVQRFLPPVYDDGIQSVRRSVRRGKPLPSARDISSRIHQDRNHELQTVTLMYMQWGQFIDHDLISTPKSRSFNGSVPRCCLPDGRDILPPELTHPNCLPIEVSDDDWFLGQFGIRCLEFIRSAPSTRINCDLGWREQLNQATSYLDGSNVYGSDLDTAESLRTFRNGKLQYGRSQGREPLQPPDPPGGELCRSGALTTDCFQGGDGRVSEQPGLTALHTTWLRYHNILATILGQLNTHWSDEKIYQETRRVVVALIQHITYQEFLPITLGQEVMDLFELKLKRQNYYTDYDANTNPTIANSFGAAAFRFGHSLVQNSFIRSDAMHRPLFNNVSLHEEQENIENIWSLGSIDRLLLGFTNQPSQKRDEFICDELTNHLFQGGGAPFGIDLAAINIQRGRDHGIPPYTTWRKPCGLSPVRNWSDLMRLMHADTVIAFKSLYAHVDDIDLFSGGLAEKPVRGGLVGPTFACIIAQQFLNLRKGDRFWYENGPQSHDGGFTPAQLQQLRHVTFAQILCQTMNEIETIQPFVFLMADQMRNARLSCHSEMINSFDLTPWIERRSRDMDVLKTDRAGRGGSKKLSKTTNASTTTKPLTRLTTRTTKRKRTTTRKSTKKTPLQITVSNITTNTVKLENKYNDDLPKRPTFINDNYGQTSTRPTNDEFTYLFGIVPQKTTPKPIEINIKIQYYLPTTTEKLNDKKKRPTTTNYQQQDNIVKLTTHRPDVYYPIFVQQTQPQYDRFPTTSTFKPPSYLYSNFDDETVRPTNNNNNKPVIMNTGYSDDFVHNNRPDTRPYRPTYNRKTTTTTKPNYLIKPSQSGNFYQLDEEPFETTSQRPYHNVPNTNQYIYSSDYYDSSTNTRPYYNHNNKPQQQQNGYATDDETIIYNRNKKRPNTGQLLTNYNHRDDSPSDFDNFNHRPQLHYTIGHVEKLPTDRIHDKLDFDTRLFTSNDKTLPSVDDDFIKISSVKGAEDFFKSESRQSDDDLLELPDDDNVRRLVRMDVIVPSEKDETERWMVYEATNDTFPILQIPDLISSNWTCSNELPHPIVMDIELTKPATDIYPQRTETIDTNTDTFDSTTINDQATTFKDNKT